MRKQKIEIGIDFFSTYLALKNIGESHVVIQTTNFMLQICINDRDKINNTIWRQSLPAGTKSFLKTRFSFRPFLLLFYLGINDQFK